MKLGPRDSILPEEGEGVLPERVGTIDGSSCDDGGNDGELQMIQLFSPLPHRPPVAGNIDSFAFDMDEQDSAAESDTAIQGLLREITYSNSSPSTFLDACTLSRAIDITITDGTTPETGSATIDLTSVPYGAFLGTNVVNYTEGASAVSAVGLTDSIQLCAKDGSDTGLTDNCSPQPSLSPMPVVLKILIRLLFRRVEALPLMAS